MNKEAKNIAPARGAGKFRYLTAAMLGIALILLTGGFIRKTDYHPASLQNSTSPTPAPSLTVSSDQTSAKPQYHKKMLVYKRPLADAENLSIRTSTLSDGYKALSAIPPYVVNPQLSVRVPQFPDSSALNNYQALSTLGTQQYYSNLNVQQYLNNLSVQQNWRDLTNQVYWNNLANQAYVNNINLNSQQYLNNFNNLNSQQFLNNFNNNLYYQQYSNNFNSLNTQQYLNNFNNNFNNQQYLNNYNTFTNPTFSNPTFYQPPPQIYIPPPSFNFP
jgi:hypothetical protein